MGGVRVPQTILDARCASFPLAPGLAQKPMEKEFVRQIVEEAVAAYPELFVVQWTLSSDNDIRVVVDGDRGVDMETLVALSRAIEHHPGMDREREDFSISVLSPGADAPLVLPRQYAKHVGRQLKVLTAQGEEILGTLDRADGQGIALVWTAREPKPVGKGRHTVVHMRELAYDRIDKAQVVLKF